MKADNLEADESGMSGTSINQQPTPISHSCQNNLPYNASLTKFLYQSLRWDYLSLVFRTVILWHEVFMRQCLLSSILIDLKAELIQQVLWETFKLQNKHTFLKDEVPEKCSSDKSICYCLAIAQASLAPRAALFLTSLILASKDFPCVNSCTLWSKKGVISAPMIRLLFASFNAWEIACSISLPSASKSAGIGFAAVKDKLESQEYTCTVNLHMFVTINFAKIACAVAKNRISKDVICNPVSVYLQDTNMMGQTY